MSVHNSAKIGDIADVVLLPGDPQRAKFIADNFLEDAVCYNEVRGMLGYTGNYKGVKVSVQGTGMGIPSISIVVNELIKEYGCKTLIRVGSCGSMQEHIAVGDIVIAQSASTDSAVNRLRFNGSDYASTASFNILERLVAETRALDLKFYVGSVLSSDTFYGDEHLGDTMLPWRVFNTLAVEMEAAALFTLASKYRVDAGVILTVSDSLISGEQLSAIERERGFSDMLTVALNSIM